MKKHTKFILLYSLSFVLISLICVALANGSGSMEMFAYALWGNIFYIPVSILGWIGINFVARPLTNTLAQSFLRFFLGFIIIFMLIIFAGGGGGNFLVLLAIFCLYTISFRIASTAYRKSDKDEIGQKAENTIT